MLQLIEKGRNDKGRLMGSHSFIYWLCYAFRLMLIVPRKNSDSFLTQAKTRKGHEGVIIRVIHFRYNILLHLDRHDLHCRFCSSDWDHRAAFRIFRSLPPNQKWQEPLQKPIFMIDWWNPSGAARGSTFTGTAWWSGWCRCQTWRFESDLSIWNISINRLNNQIDRQQWRISPGR